MSAAPAMKHGGRPKWWRDPAFWTAIGIGAAVTITVAVIQTHLANQRALEPNLLNTRTGFPNRIEIATKQIITKAEPHDKILILLDDLATEHYSSPEQFALYFKALQDGHAKQIDIEMIASGLQDFHESFKSQFQEDRWQDAQYKDSKNSFETYNRYIHFYTYTWHLISEHGEKRPCNQKPTAFDQFEKTLQCTENEYCKAFKEHGLEPKRWPSEKLGRQPLYFWLVPGKKLLFTIPKFGQKGPIDAPSFLTGQTDFLNAFQERFKYVDTVAIPDAVCLP